MTRIDKVGLSVWETLALVRGEQALQQAREAGLVTAELAALIEAADRSHDESWALIAQEVVAKRPKCTCADGLCDRHMGRL